ncbi:MAG: hypothetical protein AAGA31_01360, partial [Bacteroidota bacterium]
MKLELRDTPNYHAKTPPNTGLFNMDYRFLSLLFFLTLLVAPREGYTQEAAENRVDMVLRVRATAQGNFLNWYPADPAVWLEAMNQGYRITRAPITDAGADAGAEAALQVAMFPKPPAWFNEHQKDLDGLMAPIGSLLYDTTFQFPENDLLDAVAMRYNFIVYETTLYPSIADAAGLGLRDTLALPGVGYRYTISSNDGKLTASIDLPPGRVYAQEPAISPVNFTFPNGKSLSQMYQESHPQETGMIQLIHRAMGDSVILRWGPSTPKLWEKAMEEGYQVYRGNREEKPELIAEVFPWEEDRITPALKGNSMALAAAGILYGEQKPSEGGNLLDEAMQYENRYGLALFTAERSPEAADILGLRYVDTEVKADSCYTYYVRTPSIQQPLLWGKRVVFNVYEPVAEPVGLQANPGDKYIRLTWDKLENSRLYSAYQLE